MMKNVQAIILSVLTVCMLAIGLVGCHSHEYTETIVPPTCTEKGYTLYQCSCGDNYIGNYVDSKGHVETEWIIETKATCTTNGLRYKKCTICGETTTTSIIYASHKYENNKCTVCGKIDPNYPCIEIPQTPVSLNSYSYSGSIASSCTITSMDIHDYYYNSTGKYAQSAITFTIQKTYDSQGSSYSSGCRFGYKIYNEDNFVIKSGSIYTNAITVGEKTQETLTLYNGDLEAGHEYRLVLLNSIESVMLKP